MKHAFTISTVDAMILRDALQYLAEDTKRHHSDRRKARELRDRIDEIVQSYFESE